jgi:hypothetical protein
MKDGCATWNTGETKLADAETGASFGVWISRSTTCEFTSPETSGSTIGISSVPDIKIGITTVTEIVTVIAIGIAVADGNSFQGSNQAGPTQRGALTCGSAPKSSPVRSAEC